MRSPESFVIAHRSSALRILAAVTIVAGAALVYRASSAIAATTGGTATYIDTTGSGAALSGQLSSSKLFGVQLPANAACSGDTQHDGYLVVSYLVASGTDPGSIRFSGAIPDTGFGLFDNSGSLLASSNTAPNTGQIVSLPSNLQWSQAISVGTISLSDLVPSGTSATWESGIACINSSGAVTDYWNDEITFTDSGSDPGGFVWTSSPGQSSPIPTTTTTTAATKATTTTTSSTSTTSTTQPATTTTIASTSTTDPAASGSTTTTIAAAVVAGGSSDPPVATASSGDGTGGGLAFTGRPLGLELFAGLVLVGGGVLLTAGTIRRRPVAAPIWPDQLGGDAGTRWTQRP